MIPEIDLLIYQPISENYKNNFQYSSKYILTKLKKGCKSISFPSCYFRGYYPELVGLKDEHNRHIAIDFHLEDKQLMSVLVHDANFIRGFLAGKSCEDIKQYFWDKNLYSKGFLEKTLLKTLSNLQSREDKNNVDIRIAQFIEENFKKTRLFHTFNHPTIDLFKYIASCICEYLSIEEDFSTPITEALGYISFPIYPSVYKNLNLQFDNFSKYRILGHYFELEDVINQYLQFYKELPVEILQKSVENWNPK